MRRRSLIRLSRDHHHGLALALRCRKQALGQLKPMGVQGLRERAVELREFFFNNLERHFQAEEEILFSSIGSFAPQSRSLIEEMLRDHGEIRKGIAQLGGNAGLSRVLFDLGDLLERHIRREERELFPLFEDHAEAVEAERVRIAIDGVFTPYHRTPRT